MDPSILAKAMCSSLSIQQYAAYLPEFINGMIAAGCTNQRRAAMWCAQVGHESSGLRYMQELADGSAYNNRIDLGNTQPGDGPRFKGRGPIQLTGRINYLRFGQWCASKGYVSDPNTFVNNPLLVAQPHWGFLAASWYWTVARPQLNAQSDAGDVNSATRSVNGGLNGLADRQARYNICMGLNLVPSVDSGAQQRLFLV